MSPGLLSLGRFLSSPRLICWGSRGPMLGLQQGNVDTHGKAICFSGASASSAPAQLFPSFPILLLQKPGLPEPRLRCHSRQESWVNPTARREGPAGRLREGEVSARQEEAGPEAPGPEFDTWDSQLPIAKQKVPRNLDMAAATALPGQRLRPRGRRLPPASARACAGAWKAAE